MKKILFLLFVLISFFSYSVVKAQQKTIYITLDVSSSMGQKTKRTNAKRTTNTITNS